MKKLFLIVFALFMFSVSKAQYLLVEKYEPKEILESGQTNIVKIPFSKYKLDNGLTFIISEDHNNPLVNINVTYKIGSANDYADRTGMAYLIYTLMDNGSKHLHSGEYKKIINHYGGKMYSTITRDKTTFSATVPKNLLATVLWMESDRQAYFLDSITKGKFDNAKLDIIAKIYDSLYHQPYGLTDVIAVKNLYPYAHPYTWPEFGMMDHYQTYQLPDLKKYFLDWYGSNNTIITITGDVNTQEVIAMVNQYFGTLTTAPHTQVYVDDIVNRIMLGAGTELTEPRYVSYKINVPNPLLKVVFNTVPRFNADEKALNVIAAILGQGNNSVLYNEFVKKGYAIYVNAQHKTYRYYGEFTIDIMAKADTSLAVIAKKLDKLLNDIVLGRNIYANSAIGKFPGTPGTPVLKPPQNLTPQANIPPPQPVKPTQPNLPPIPVVVPQPNKTPQGFVPPQPIAINPLSPEQINLNESRSAEVILRTVSKLKSEELWSLESLQNKGLMLSDREMVNGKPSEISPSLIEYDQINPQTFFGLFSHYMLTNAKLYVSYTSKDKAKLIADSDNIRELELQTILTPSTEQDLVYRYPVKEINKKQPKIKDIPVSAKIDIKPETTQNGLVINLVQSKGFPIVTINMRMNTSKIKKLLPTLDVTGMIAWLYTDWLESQGNDNPLKGATLTGSVVQFKSEKDFINISILCPKEHVFLIKEALVQMLSREEYGTNAIIPQFTALSENPLSSSNFKKTNFDDIIQCLSSNPSDKLIQKDSATKAAFALKQARITFASLFTPKNMSVSIYGDIDEGQYRDMYMNLTMWQTLAGRSGTQENQIINPDSINVNELKSPPAGNIYFLPDKNKENAKIIVEYMQLPVEVTANYYTGGLANYIFGMSSDNYLSKSLKAYDYILDVKTMSYYRNNMQCFAVALYVKAEKFVDAYNNLMKILDNFKTFKADKNYFNAAKTEYLYKNATSYETQTQKEQYSNYLIANHLSNDVVNNKYAFTKKIKASKISKFWKSAYNTQTQRIIVIGNDTQIPSGIISTGNKMVLIDRSGTVINQ